MVLEITIGPPWLLTSQGYGVPITNPDGQMRWPIDKGYQNPARELD
jgi:hypothetical protein